MKIKNIFILVGCLILLSACERDEPSKPSSSTSTSNVTVTKPSFDKFLTSTDLDGFDLMVRFKSGDDYYENISGTVYWRAYGSKPTTTPKKSDMNKKETARLYTATYYNSGTKKGRTSKVVLEKAHAGYSGGTYIYYYMECRNSKGSAQSDLSYTIVKR